MSDQIKLKINGRDLEVPKGTTVLEAARTIGVEIPHFCYHPALEKVGSCRMCQVEFTAGGRTFLGVSCRTDVTEGLEVQSHSEDAVRARAGVLEFLLANHPLDCPICDKAGECPLQNYSYEHGFTESRFKEERRKDLKKTELGGHIIFDAERCILCTRCVRFMADYAKAPQLTVSGRGDHSRIATFPGEKLDSAYTGNLADICPVGALTLEEFRFKCRSWNLTSTASICPYCSRGCNIHLEHRTGRTRLLRVRPRPNKDVHGCFICNEGRFRPLEAAAEARLEQPLVDGSPASLDSAVETAARRFGGYTNRLAVIISPRRSTEEIYLIKRVFESLARDKIIALRPESEEPDGVLRTGERAANVKALNLLHIPLVSPPELDKILADNGCDALFLADPELAIPLEIWKLMSFKVFLGHAATEMALTADVAIPGLTWMEKAGTFINFQGRVQRFEPAFPPPAPGVFPDLVTLSRLGALLIDEEQAPDPAEAADIFNKMTAEADAFSGLRYSDLGENGALLPGEEGGGS